MRVEGSLDRRGLRVRLVGLMVLVGLGAATCSTEGTPPQLEWESPAGRDHALVGCIWDVAAARCIGADALVAHLAQRQLVLLGEKHDNPDHHRLQAHVLDRLVASGRRPAVAFEMLAADHGPALASLRGRGGADPQAIRRAVSWDDAGWPAFAIYEPVFASALDADLPIVAANLSQEDDHRLGRGGLEALDPAEVARLGLDQPLPEEQRRDLSERIRDAHCGQLPEAAVPRMIDMQRAWDAQLARSLVDALADKSLGIDGAVLIAGTEHARRDRAVPRALERWAPDATLASVAFLEVPLEPSSAEAELSERYGDEVPFDFVWFTPRVDDEDPCEKYRESLERLGRRNAPAAQVSLAGLRSAVGPSARRPRWAERRASR